MAQVTVSGLDKFYGAMQVLHGIDFDVANGDFIALVGPSGCGKSTLLRMIAGLEDISGGTVSIAGDVVNDAPPKDRDIAMVFQNYALYPHMTVAKNMGFSLRLRGGNRDEIDRRVTAAAEILGLSEFLDRMPGQLSGGQRQRVAMGRAIVRQPSVFLFDEPLSNLDAALRVQMRAEIRLLHERLKSTSIFVTHDQVEAMTMADRIVVLRKGHLEQVGAPLDLYDRPANAFVAGFIGSPAMNILPVLAEGGRLTLAGDRSFPVPCPVAGKVQWGIRPEHLQLVATDTPDSLTGVVTNVERTGHSDFVAIDLDGMRVDALFTERHPIATGDRISVQPLPGKSHFFDAVNGNRLE